MSTENQTHGAPPEEAQVKLPSMQTVTEVLASVANQPHASPKASPTQQSANNSAAFKQPSTTGTAANGQLGGTALGSASKMRKITDFLPPIRSVSILQENLTNQTQHIGSGHPDNSSGAVDVVFNPSGTRHGNQIMCRQCGLPYSTENIQVSDTVSIFQPQAGEWVCKRCTDSDKAAVTKNLIAELKEKARVKALEREQKELQKREEKETAKLKRELEMQQRRDAKLQAKEEIRQRKVEKQALNSKQPSDSTEDQNGEQGTKKQTQADQLRQTKLSMEKKKAKSRPEQVLTEAEREKLEEKKLIKSQFAQFSVQYPEYIDRNQIKYPIEDTLIGLLPELHSSKNCTPKPSMHSMQISGVEFEQLLHIWEFCNNFSDYLETPQFKIEDLRVALLFNDTQENQLSVQEESDLDHNEQMCLQQIRERGLNLINTILTALSSCYLAEILNNPKDEYTKTELILISLDKLVEDKETIWPELCRLILIQRLEETNAEDVGEDEPFDYEETFGPSGPVLESVIKRLAGLQPQAFNSTFSYVEKIALFSALVDGVHDLRAFVQILHMRVEEKTVYNKEKMEIYQAIRVLEQEQAEILKKQADPVFQEQQAEAQKELDSLCDILAQASRTESRGIKDRITTLRQDANNHRRELQTVEDQIKRKQTAIDRISEKSFKASIRTVMLGKDADRNEYWHFKEDAERIYVRIEEPVDADPQSKWMYIDEDDKFEVLVESMNARGVRERKLLDSLKKCKDRLKLRKTKKLTPLQMIVPEETKQQVQEGSAGADVQMTEEKVQPDQISNAPENQEASNQVAAKEDSVNNEQSLIVEGFEDRVIFKNSNYKQARMHAIWFGKKVPPKRRINSRQAGNDTENNQVGAQAVFSLTHCQTLLQEIESRYTDTLKPQDKEWEEDSKRAAWCSAVKNSTSVAELTQLMLELNEGMSLPTSLIQRDNRIQRLRLQLYKFWPNQDLRESWLWYGSKLETNLNGMLLALRILQQTTEQFSVRQIDRANKSNKDKAAKLNAAGQTGSIYGQNKNQQQATNSRFQQRNFQRDYFVKYFESSDDESDEKVSEHKASEQSGEQSYSRRGAKKAAATAAKLTKKQAVKASSGRRVRRNTARQEAMEHDNQSSSIESSNSDGEDVSEQQPARGKCKAAPKTPAVDPKKLQEESVDEDDGEEGEEQQSEDGSQQDQEDDTSREWDEYCFVCQDGGNVICCDGCTNVAHLSCLKMKSQPQGDWHCKDCLLKHQAQANKSNGGAPRGRPRGSTNQASKQQAPASNKVPTRRSNRR